MEIRVTSRFLQRHVNPKLYEFRDHIGQEILVGLNGKDQYGNDMVGYITGIVGLEKEGGLEVGLYEIIDEKTGKGIANRIMPLNRDTPISEAFLPATVVAQETDCSREEKTGLTYRVKVEPHNRNSTRINTYEFKSR